MLQSSLRFEFAANDRDSARLGLIVPRRYGNAVARNRLKRWIRESFRQRHAGWPNFDIVAMPRLDAPPAEFSQVDADLAALGEALAKK
jgi:ribonuclease P protein component